SCRRMVDCNMRKTLAAVGGESAESRAARRRIMSRAVYPGRVATIQEGERTTCRIDFCGASLPCALPHHNLAAKALGGFDLPAAAGGADGRQDSARIAAVLTFQPSPS